jgi:hypothetical protein
MQGIPNIRMLSVRAGWLFVLGASLVLPVAAQAQNSEPQTSTSFTAAPKEANKAAEKPSVAAMGKNPGGLTEGLQVHGHWVIDVRNPDGTLAVHREFENSLQGNNNLARTLTRQLSVGLYLIDLVSTNQQVFEIQEPLETRTNSDVVSKNLMVTGSAGLVLSGSFTAPSAATINFVSTNEESCAANVAPITPCSNGVYNGLTGTPLSPGISFVSGQIVQLTVTVTFS